MKFATLNKTTLYVVEDDFGVRSILLQPAERLIESFPAVCGFTGVDNRETKYQVNMDQGCDPQPYHLDTTGLVNVKTWVDSNSATMWYAEKLPSSLKGYIRSDLHQGIIWRTPQAAERKACNTHRCAQCRAFLPRTPIEGLEQKRWTCLTPFGVCERCAEELDISDDAYEKRQEEMIIAFREFGRKKGFIPPES